MSYATYPQCESWVRPNTPLQRTPFSCHQFCVRKIVASFRGR
jgi:hypothetical protein